MKGRKWAVTIFVVAWVWLWLGYTARDIKEHFPAVRALFGKSVEKKWEYLIGEDLARVLRAGRAATAHNETITFISNVSSFEGMMAQFYLFPRVLGNNGRVVLVYHQQYTPALGTHVVNIAKDVYMVQR